MPLLRGGADTPIKQMPRYLRIGVAGEAITRFLSMRKLDTNLTNIPPLKKRRRELRNFATPAETRLWGNLRRKQLLGKKFNRQYSVGKYVLDFYCVECNLAIELDGAYHFDVLRQEYDAERSRYLEGLGIQIIRFENQTVFQNIEGVLETIREAMRKGTGS
jgi:very-short-patch-repair endonuclease